MGSGEVAHDEGRARRRVHDIADGAIGRRLTTDDIELLPPSSLELQSNLDGRRRAFHKLVFDTERIEHHGDIQARNTSTDNVYRELGNVVMRGRWDDKTRIDRRPKLRWVRIDKMFHGIPSSLSERGGGGISPLMMLTVINLLKKLS